jgi:hypothetical protein
MPDWILWVFLFGAVFWIAMRLDDKFNALNDRIDRLEREMEDRFNKITPVREPPEV